MKSHPDQPYDDEDLPDSIFVNGIEIPKEPVDVFPDELILEAGCDCDLCRMNIEVDEVDAGYFEALCWDAPGLFGYGGCEEEAVGSLLEFITSIALN